MKIVRRVTAISVVLFVLASCASGANNGASPTSTPSAQILEFPTCAVAKLELEKPLPKQSTPTSGSTPHALAITSGPLHLCRYRPQAQGSVTLILQIPDIIVPKAPAALLKALNHLKTIAEVFGPNAAFSCSVLPAAVDVVAIRGTKDSKLTLIRVDRGGCGFITIDHTLYVNSLAVLSELDAM